MVAMVLSASIPVLLAACCCGHRYVAVACQGALLKAPTLVAPRHIARGTKLITCFGVIHLIALARPQAVAECQLAAFGACPMVSLLA